MSEGAGASGDGLPDVDAVLRALLEAADALPPVSAGWAVPDDPRAR